MGGVLNRHRGALAFSSLLRHAFHREHAEGRVLVADLALNVAAATLVVLRLHLVHALELQNDDAVRRLRAGHGPCLVKAASYVLAAIVSDEFLRARQELFFVAVLVFHGNLGNGIGRRRCSS